MHIEIDKKMESNKKKAIRKKSDYQVEGAESRKTKPCSSGSEEFVTSTNG